MVKSTTSPGWRLEKTENSNGKMPVTIAEDFAWIRSQSPQLPSGKPSKILSDNVRLSLRILGCMQFSLHDFQTESNISLP